MLKEKSQRAADDVIYTDIAYAANDMEIAKVRDNLPDGYELLLLSDQPKKYKHPGEQDLGKYEYRCAVFINKETKEVVFANAGTRVGGDYKKKASLSDLKSDAQLTMKIIPEKMKSASKLNQYILEHLHETGEDISQYKFHYTGHSLGAVMGQLAATDMYIELKKRSIDGAEISSTTFDNPGAQPLIKKLCKKRQKEHHLDIDLDELQEKVDFQVYNNRDNFINTTHPQFGKVHEIIVDPKAKAEQPLFKHLCEKLKNFKCRFKLISNITTWLGTTIEKIAKITIKAPKIIDRHIGKQLSEHGIENFRNVLVENKGEVAMVIPRSSEFHEHIGEYIKVHHKGAKLVEFNDSVFEELQKMKQEGTLRKTKKYERYCMAKLDEAGNIQSVAFCREDLNKAIRQARSCTEKAQRSGRVEASPEGKTVSTPIYQKDTRSNVDKVIKAHNLSEIPTGRVAELIGGESNKMSKSQGAARGV